MLDPSKDLSLAEGEKKAQAGMQHSLDVVAVSGLWNWADGAGELIADFDRFSLKGRTVEIVPDSDRLDSNRHGYEENLQAAVYRLADKLKARGARVFTRRLPADGAAKVGLDDYLLTHTVEDFRAFQSPHTSLLPSALRRRHPMTSTA